MTETIFDKIIAGDIPCHRVYEDEHVLAFLDIGPLSRGHTLVIPKERASALHELSAEASAAIGRVLPRICAAIVKATACDAYNVISNTGAAAGQEVMHVHFHIIPKTEDGGLKKNWTPGSLDTGDSATLLAAIRAEL